MMRENEIRAQFKKKLKELVSFKEINIKFGPQIGSSRPDFVAKVVFKSWRFQLVGEIIKHPSSSLFKFSISNLKSYVMDYPDLVPIAVAHYLSPRKREFCKNEGINYLDLSGNVLLQYGDGLYIERIGFPNSFPYIRKGRSPFADKASLILRAMLEEKKMWGVRELADKIRLDAGYISRMFKELEKLNYLVRVNSKWKLRNKESILEDWIHYYDYKKNKEAKYFCLAKGPKEVIEKLKRLNIPGKINYALGFHAGAFLISPYSVFNEVHIYLSDEENMDFFVNQLSLKPVEQGVNIVFLFPFYKNSVFFGKQKVKNLWVVSDIQLYLDLYKYPLRGIEQAEHLYEKGLKKLIESEDLSNG